MSTIAWPENATGAAPAWYVGCFRNSLRRVAATINGAAPYASCARVDLDQSDTDLEALFKAKGWDRSHTQFNVALYDPLIDSDEHRAEYFFYSDIDFVARTNVRVARFVVPQTFLDWGYKRLHRPEGNDDELGVKGFGGSASDPTFITHCATNYLVKNFWHNFVHRVVQGIGSHNYHEFRGLAREDSDFEADHIANLLLVRAYGLPLYTKGKIGVPTAARIRSLFARNRCNLIFAERALHRTEDRERMTRIERWEELEWRFCRAVSNAVSTALIAEGLAVPSIRVFLSGDVRTKAGRRGYSIWRTGATVVDVGGVRINSKCPPYIPADELRAEEGEGRPVTPERRKTIREFRAKREQLIVANVVAAFRERILTDKSLAKSVSTGLAALGERMGVVLL